MRWPSASHHPQKTNQRTSPMTEAAPASERLTTVLPNGHSANTAMRSEAMPSGIVMIKTKQTRAVVLAQPQTEVLDELLPPPGATGPTARQRRRSNSAARGGMRLIDADRDEAVQARLVEVIGHHALDDPPDGVPADP
jgi:hypothetical protein